MPLYFGVLWNTVVLLLLGISPFSAFQFAVVYFNISYIYVCILYKLSHLANCVCYLSLSIYLTTICEGISP